jgi:hypothetical protein
MIKCDAQFQKRQTGRKLHPASLVSKIIPGKIPDLKGFSRHCRASAKQNATTQARSNAQPQLQRRQRGDCDAAHIPKKCSRRPIAPDHAGLRHRVAAWNSTVTNSQQIKFWK